MKNGLAEDILGEEGRSWKLRTRGRENENFAYEEKNAGNCAYEAEGMKSEE